MIRTLLENEKLLETEIVEMLEGKIKRGGADGFDCLMAFVETSKAARGFQIADNLKFFDMTIGQPLRERLQTLSTKLAPSQIQQLLEILVGLPWAHWMVRELCLQVIARTKDAGEFQQVMPFLRDMAAASPEQQIGFTKSVIAESERTMRGGRSPKQTVVFHLPDLAQQLPNMEALLYDRLYSGVRMLALADSDASSREVRILLDPAKARSKFKRYLVDSLTGRVAKDAEEQRALRADIGVRSALWDRGDFLTNLASLASFSDDEGVASIRDLMLVLTSRPSIKATAVHDNRRFFDRRRYRDMRKAFPPEFISRWANGDEDRVIPLGELNVDAALASDPMALKRSRCDYVVRQMARHMEIEKISGKKTDELVTAIKIHMDKVLSSKFPAINGFKEIFNPLLDSLMKLENVSEDRITAVLEYLQKNKELIPQLGENAHELLNDLKQFRRGLKSGAISGRAWLVVTSDPSDFLSSGKNPVTCQDPTRSTGYNEHGELVNRPLDGKYLFGKVVIASDIHLENGVAVASKDAKQVGRGHFAATTKSGKPVPKSSPHLLVDNTYFEAGFVSDKEFAAGVNTFAKSLGFDPKKDVSIGPMNIGMANHPSPLPSRHVYWDTFSASPDEFD